MAANMGLIAKNVSLTQLPCTDRFHVQKISIRGFTRNQVITAGKPLIRKMKLEKPRKKQKKFRFYV
jgi:hypothetical protein